MGERLFENCNTATTATKCVKEFMGIFFLKITRQTFVNRKDNVVTLQAEWEMVRSSSVMNPL